MKISVKQFVIVIALALMALSSARAARDTTIVAFFREPLDIAHKNATKTVFFPVDSERYKTITLTYIIDCALEGCDPWDHVGVVTLSQEESKGTTELYELARVVTPFGRGGQWTIDVTEYQSLLHDSVHLGLYLQTFIGGGKGSLITVWFTFTGGTPDFIPYKIENLWAGLPEYGNPHKPIEDILKPIGLKADPGAAFAKIQCTVTGHGTENTDNAAEYSRKKHELVVGGTVFTHELWRGDCADNPCHPQEGDWKASHAGFCPGDMVVPWENDISALIRPGQLFTIDYNVEPYENKCRPGSDPCPCGHCDYDYITHVQPYYWVESQIIYYKVPSNENREHDFKVASDSKGSVVLTPNIGAGTAVDITVITVMNEELYHAVRNVSTSAPIRLDLSTTPGCYLLKIAYGGKLYRKQIVVL